jgi:hypothetical protein
MTAAPTVLSEGEKDEIRVRAARDAEAVIAGAIKAHGSSPDVVAAAVIGLMAGCVAVTWQNRTKDMKPVHLRRILRAMLDSAARAVFR